MKIAIDVSILSTPWPTGVERTQRSLLRELAAIDRANDYLLVARRALPPGALGFELPPNFRLVDLSPKKPGYLWRERLLVPLLEQERVDLFHSPVLAIPIGGSFARVATVHEVPWLERRVALEAARRVWLCLNARFARRLVAVSERTRDNVLRLHPHAKERVDVVPHGVEPCFRVDAPVEPRAQLLPRLAIADAPYLLFVGAARRKKNLDLLLAAFARVPEAARGATQLVLAGVRDEGRLGLPALAAKLGLAERVRFPGFVSDADLAGLYRHALALVLPSRFEGFGLPPLEAMAGGTPVIASSGGALPEVVGDAALLVPPGEVAPLAAALERVLADAPLRAELRRRGLERAAPCTWRRAALRLQDVWAACGAKAATA